MERSRLSPSTITVELLVGSKLPTHNTIEDMLLLVRQFKVPTLPISKELVYHDAPNMVIRFIKNIIVLIKETAILIYIIMS
jgi:hypothetical protein